MADEQQTTDRIAALWAELNVESAKLGLSFEEGVTIGKGEYEELKRAAALARAVWQMPKTSSLHRLENGDFILLRRGKRLGTQPIVGKDEFNHRSPESALAWPSTGRLALAPLDPPVSQPSDDELPDAEAIENG